MDTWPCQAPLFLGFPRHEYWSGLPFASPGDLPVPGVEPASSVIAGRFFTIWATREAPEHLSQIQITQHITDIHFLMSLRTHRLSFSLSMSLAYTPNSTRSILISQVKNRSIICLSYGERRSYWIKKDISGNSLGVQWLRLSTFTAEGLGSIPGPKIPQVTWLKRKKEKRETSKTT